MEYLTCKEYAELKGCSIRYVKKIAQQGKLSAIQELNPDNNCMQYKIPVSALPDDLKAKYYGRLRKAENAPPELKNTDKKEEKPRKNAVKKSFEEFSAEERGEITRWSEIIKEWQALRGSYKKKTEFDPLFCAKLKLEQPDIEVSPDILYRKYAAYREQDWNGLIDKRGAWNKGRFEIDERVWKAFLWFYLDERQPNVSECYRNVRSWTEEFYPELLGTLPSERSFHRHIESDVAVYVKTYKREGEKALLDRCSPYVERLYDRIEANSVWIADNHTLDVISADGAKKHRLYITAFQDAKSGVIVGFNITENPSSQSTVVALRMGISRFGVPYEIYLDNGSEFANYDIAGRGYRTKRKYKDEPAPANIFQRLGIAVHFAQVRNADAKPIERTFYTLKEQFSKALETFCGGNITERPESLKRVIKNGGIPTDTAVREYIRVWIDYDYNLQPYCGREKGYEDMTRLDVWNTSIKRTGVRLAEEAELNLMLMRSTRFQKVKRNGVFVSISGEKLWYYDKDETCRHIGETVCVRYDPADLSSVRIYDKDDRYIFTWRTNNVMLEDYIEENKDNVRNGEEMRRSVIKFMKKSADELTAGLPAEQYITALDMKIRKAYENSEKFRIELPSRIIPIKSGEELPVSAAVGSDIMNVTIDYEKINRNIAKRKENGDR